MICRLIFLYRGLRRWHILLILEIAILVFVPELAGGVLSIKAVLRDCVAFVRELADGVLSFAAVLRGGL